MKKAEKEERIAELWKEYNEVLKERQGKEKEAKALKVREDGLKGELCALVPEDGELGGVEHRVYEKPSVEYSKVFAEVVKELVPKRKQEEAEAIRERFTKVNKQHSVRGAE